MFLVNSTTQAEVATAKANALKMQSVEVTPVDGLTGAYTVKSIAQPKGGQPGRVNRYMVILRAVTGGFETFCNCEAGTPTHANQDVKLCKHVAVSLETQKVAEIAAITAKFAALGF